MPTLLAPHHKLGGDQWERFGDLPASVLPSAPGRRQWKEVDASGAAPEEDLGHQDGPCVVLESGSRLMGRRRPVPQVVPTFRAQQDLCGASRKAYGPGSLSVPQS